MQVMFPTMTGDNERDRTRKRKAWLKSLAALMASQPASHQIILQQVYSPVLRAAQILAPWITSLTVTMDQNDDMGKVLKGAIKVGLCSLTWGAFPELL